MEPQQSREDESNKNGNLSENNTVRRNLVVFEPFGTIAWSIWRGVFTVGTCVLRCSHTVRLAIFLPQQPVTYVLLAQPMSLQPPHEYIELLLCGLNNSVSGNLGWTICISIFLNLSL